MFIVRLILKVDLAQ